MARVSIEGSYALRFGSGSSDTLLRMHKLFSHFVSRRAHYFTSKFGQMAV